MVVLKQQRVLYNSCDGKKSNAYIFDLGFNFIYI